MVNSNVPENLPPLTLRWFFYCLYPEDGRSELLKSDAIYFLSGRALFPRRPEHSSTMMEELALFGFKQRSIWSNDSLGSVISKLDTCVEKCVN